MVTKGIDPTTGDMSRLHFGDYISRTDPVWRVSRGNPYGPVQMGTAATDDTPHQGRLQLIDNQVDVKSGTIRVRASFDNQDGTLIPGQFARIRMGQAQTVHALLVNERAVGTDQNKKFVFVVGADNKAQYREVALGAPVNGLRVVTEGLKPGERIVVNGLQRVRPGALLKTEVATMGARGPQQASNHSNQDVVQR